MSRRGVMTWWPPIGLLAMVALGLLVGKGSTGLDDWFIRFGAAHRSLHQLLFFTKPLMLACILIAALAFAVYRRRWRLVAVIGLTPLVAIVAARVLKEIFGREKGGEVAYPSGHTTAMVVVLGLAVAVAGAATWAVVVAVAFGILGLAGQAFTYHYFTDTIGAVLLGTALVCLAVRAAGLDRCQPACDLRHTQG